ncbi:unnamed protein product [Orchesella dallaii]|uniref:C2H2-type domain-containing protein n=1 Tax=Orchesella dallaii TaxID=48710 RepID=A0ABP1S4Y2_9HEXA
MIKYKMGSKSRNRLCFLCYKPAASKEKHTSETVNGLESKFLLLLLRYLKIHPNLNKIKNEFLCCEDCAMLGNSFCDLYFQRECIKLQLEWKLRRIYETMVCAERVPSRVIAFLTQFENPQNEEDRDELALQIFSEIEETRENLVNCCKIKLKFSKPRVLLQKFPDNQDTQTEEIKGDKSSLKKIKRSYPGEVEGQVPDPEKQADVDSREEVKLQIAESPLPPSCHDHDENDDLDWDNEDHNVEHDERLTTFDDNALDNPIKPGKKRKSDQITKQDLANGPNLLKTVKDSKTEELNPSISDANTPRKSLRSRFTCSKCSKSFTTQAKLENHLKIHEENLILDDNSDLDCDLVTKKEEHEEFKLREEEGGDEDDRQHSDVDMEACSKGEDELSSTKQPRNYYYNPVKRRDAKIPFTQCEECLVNYDCEAAVEKCRVVNHKLKKYVCCHLCRKMLNHHSHLLNHRAKGRKCFTNNPKDLEPASAPLFPSATGKEISGSKFCLVEGCNEVFRFDELLQIHEKTHGNWECSFCQEEFGKAHELAEHELSEHIKNSASVKEAPNSNEVSTVELSKRKLKLAGKSLSCSRCTMKYATKSRQISHFVYDHLGIPKVRALEKVQRECEICKVPFLPKISENDIKKHVETQHNVEELDPSLVSKCTICQAPFKLRLQLANHMRVVHKQKTQFKCPHCEKTKFRSCVKFRKHVLKAHGEKSTGLAGAFECDICKEKFERKYSLEQHLKCHMKDDKVKVFKCEKCPKTFSKNRNLANHIINVHKTPESTWHCDQCGKMFKFKGKLDQHMSYTHTDPSQWKFVCPKEGCGKRCWSNQKLREHIRTHTTERPFICDFCGETYRTPYTLRTHLAKVHGETAAKTLPTKGYSKPFDQKLKEKAGAEDKESEAGDSTDASSD